MSKQEIICGDSKEVLKTFEENSVDLLCTDPPYGYSFMGKDWDKAVPSVEIWKECLRVLKPGAFAFIMSAPRSDVQCAMISRLQEAGFRLDFTPIYWTYASGFPKAMNIGKMVDKRLGRKREITGRNPNSREKATKKNSLYEPGTVGKTAHITKGDHPLEGSYGGFQPKPAVEVIIVAMKPLSEKTFVDQALKNGRGITWLDDARIPITDGKDLARENLIDKGNFGIGNNNNNAQQRKEKGLPPVGRFPANLLVSDDVLNDGTVTKSTGVINRFKSGAKPFGGAVGEEYESVQGTADSGSYSRYFDLDAWAKTLPFLIVPKAGKREKNEGVEHLEGNMHKTGARTYDDICANCKKKLFGDIPFRCVCEEKITEKRTTKGNFHPTVKPLTLMSYLITLGTRPNDVVLDPFVGSGTTCIAAKNLGRQYIGIELKGEFIAIANGRLNSIPSPMF